MTTCTSMPSRAPAHDEWYLRLTRAQAEYPQILTAYDAVFDRAAELLQGKRANPVPAENAVMYPPPLLEESGLAELTREARNNRMRAI